LGFQRGSKLLPEIYALHVEGKALEEEEEEEFICIS